MKVKTGGIKSELSLKQTLDEMYELSKSGDEPFYNLIELMCNEQTIITAIHNIKSNKGSKTAGIDSKTVDDYLQLPYEVLVDMVREAIINYNPMPVKRKHIEKANGKLRPLGIPTMIDRIIQEITRIAIEPIAEAKFYYYSFGFRPMRDASQAMAEIIERIRRNKTYWVIEEDIKGFFDNINHNKLISMLWNIGIRDRRVLAIIKKMLKSGVTEEDGKLHPSDVGSPQGGILSPLLANIYLNFFDWMIAKKFIEHPAKYKVKDVERVGLRRVRQRHQDIYLVRYADDWVILCKTEEQANKTLKEIDKYFNNQLKIELSTEKTKITDIRKEHAEFLGFEFFAEKARSGEHITGKIIPNTKKANEKVKEIIKEIRHINRIGRETPKRRMRDIALQIEKVNSKIVGLTQYYSISNCSLMFGRWDNRINFQQYKTWLRLTGSNKWKECTIPANLLDNRRTRHESRSDRLYYVEADKAKIGITRFNMTPSRPALRVNQALSPYTDEGRKIYEKNTEKKTADVENGNVVFVRHAKSKGINNELKNDLQL